LLKEIKNIIDEKSFGTENANDKTNRYFLGGIMGISYFY